MSGQRWEAQVLFLITYSLISIFCILFSILLLQMCVISAGMGYMWSGNASCTTMLGGPSPYQVRFVTVKNIIN